jgi:lipopolysaccharide export system protein LptA
MKTHAAWLLSAVLGLAGAASLAGAGESPRKDPKKDPPPATPEFSIKEAELQRLPVPRMGAFPWIGQQKPPAKVPESKAPDQGQDPLIDVTSGDVTIAASGPFARTVEKVRDDRTAMMEDKEVFSLQKDVEILQPATGSVLRGQSIKLVRDTDSGDMERLEARGRVEIVFGARKARGEMLTYETKFGPLVKTPAGMRKEAINNIVTVEGDLKLRKPATLWAGDDAIQAQRFVLDLRRDTFRALGGALIQITLPTQSGSPAPADNQNKNAMFPGLSLTSGAKVFLSSDGDFLYEGFSGRIALKRNVQAKQEGFLLVADEMEIQLDLAPDRQAQTGVFAGSLRSLQCKGRIEIKTPDQVVHCDQLLYDLFSEHLRMEMTDPKADVKIYSRNPAKPDTATSIVQVLRRIDIDTRTKNMADTDPNAAPTRRRIVNFPEPVPIPNPRPSYKTER